MQGPQLTARFHLTTGIEETYVAHWFCEEGNQVQGLTPLVTLRHPLGMTFTLRTPPAGPLSGAVLQQILVSEGTSVSASDILAVLTKVIPDEARAQIGALEPGSFPYDADMNVEIIPSSSSRLRDAFFKKFPGFHTFYFRTYPLLPLLNMGCFAIILVLCTLLIPHLLVQVSGTSAPSGRDELFSLFTLAGLILLALIILASLTLTAARLFLLRHR